MDYSVRTDGATNTLGAGLPVVSISRLYYGPRPVLRQRVLCLVVLAITIFPLWFSLGDHPLYPHSEGRYASVSKDMLQNNHWLVPRYDGKVHLTKPPLAYWAQAGAMAWLGTDELACRLPSAFAGTMVLVMLFGLCWAVCDLRLAALATGLLGMMPLFVVVSRLTLTDALLNMFWFGAMAAGFLALRQPAGRKKNLFVIALWLAVAGGWMTKGPLALVPVGVLVIWLALSGSWRRIFELKPVAGFILSLFPIAAWVGLVAVRDPEAWHLWYMQMIGRAIGTGDHPQPVWYFLPIFLGGLFPATTFLWLPWSNYSWRKIWPMIRSGSSAAYWGLQVVLPLIMFSLIKGKLATYILPLCAPLAIISAQVLLDWIDRKHDHPPEGVRPPEVVGTFFISLAAALAVILGLLVYQYGTEFLIAIVFMALVLAAAGWLWWAWKRYPAWRATSLLILFLAYMIGFGAIGELEDVVLTPGSTRKLVHVIDQKLGPPQPVLVTYGYRDTTLAFYDNDWDETENPKQLRRLLKRRVPHLVVIAEMQNWKKLEKTHPQLTAKFQLLFEWAHSPLTKKRLILQPRAEHPRPHHPVAAPKRQSKDRVVKEIVDKVNKQGV